MKLFYTNSMLQRNGRLFPLMTIILSFFFFSSSASAQLNTWESEDVLYLSTSECATGLEETPVYNAEFELRVVELINDDRELLGLPPLKLNPQLCAAARYHAKDMCDDNYFAHESKNAAGATVCGTFDRIGAFYDYNAAAENVAAGYFTPEEVHAGLMASPGHYANIMSELVREVGVGYWFDMSADYFSRWVIDFGTNVNVYPVVVDKEYVLAETNMVDLYVYGESKYDQLRVRNEGQAWSAWQPFTSQMAWEMVNASGEQKVYVEMKNNSGVQTNSAEDEIILDVVGGGSIPTPSGVKVQAKALLEGAYDSNGDMFTTLNDNSLLSTTQPFNVAPFNYNGTETADFSDLPPTVVDWVLVEIRDDANTELVVERKAGLLLDDGTLIDIEGNVGINFDNLQEYDSYHVLLRHRNHLALASALPIELPNAVAVDFTDPSYVFGGTTQLSQMSDGTYCMVAGDMDSNGVITTSDFNVLLSESAILNQYIVSDCNLDGQNTVGDLNVFRQNMSIIGVNMIKYE